MNAPLIHTAPHATIAVRSLRPLVNLLDQLGLGADHLLSHYSLTRESLKDGNARLDHAEVVSLWKEAAVLTGDELIGLRAATMIENHVFDVLSYAFRTSENLLEAYQRFFRHFKLFHNYSDTGLLFVGEGVVLYHLFSPELESPRFFSDYILSAWVVAARNVSQTSIHPSLVVLPYPKPVYSSELESFFQCPIQYNGKRAEMHFALADLKVLLPERDELLSKMIDQHIEALLAEFSESDSFTRSLRKIIAEMLCSTELSAVMVAGKMGLSERTFFRRLRQQGLSFQGVVDSIKLSSAKVYLSKPELSMNEISFLLGFSELSSFHRAFKRWTNTTPASYRQVLMSKKFNLVV